MTVGVFYAWDFLVLIAMTVCYWHCPIRFIEKKQEYVKFALLFLSVYFFIFLVLRNICGWEDAVVHEVWWVLLFPCLWLGHRFYPFRAVRRNQHLNFFLFFMALYVIILYGSSMFVSAFGNM